MAYCPLVQAGELKKDFIENKVVKALAQKYEATEVQILLSFVLYNKNLIVIPKASSKSHMLLNRQAYDIKLEKDDYDMLDKEFSAPKYKTYLDIV